jgi:hypothetical protein
MLATSILMVLSSAGMALYLRILAAFSKVAKLSLFGSLKNLHFNRQSRRAALSSRKIGPRAAGKIFELELHTTLNHAERTVI